MRLLACLAMAIALMNDPVFAQAPTNVPISPATNTPPDPDEKAWSFSASGYTYFVPDDSNYVQPTFTADRGWLHLEARYNYEALDTGSAWLGYNFSGGEKLAWEFTPMIGGVFGDTAGIAPGYKGSLSWWKLELYSEGEYVFDTRSTSDSFFYNWSELALAPAEWFRFGMVTQRTRVIQDRSRHPARRARRLRLQAGQPDRLCVQSGRRQAHFCARGRSDFLKSSPEQGSGVGACRGLLRHSGGPPGSGEACIFPRGPQAPGGSASRPCVARTSPMEAGEPSGWHAGCTLVTGVGVYTTVRSR